MGADWWCDMTIEQRLAALESQMSTLAVNTLAESDPSGYYTSVYTGEQIDQAVGSVLDGTYIIQSSTPGSVKKFRVSVDDAGTLTAVEV